METPVLASKDMPMFPKNFGKVFFNNQFRTKIALPTLSTYPSLEGKVAIITGSNTGLGFESAKQFLQLGLSHLVVAVRSLEKGQTAAEKLKLLNSKATIDVWELDMESYKSIQEFAERCKTLPRIDYTILNAGISVLKFKLCATGHETNVQVNHISTCLLMILLLPILKAKSTRDDPAKLTVVNSLTAHLCKFENRDQRPLLASLDDTKITPWDSQERYGVSKLLCQLFLVELCSHIDPSSVTITMVEPCLTQGTGLFREAKGIMYYLVWLFLAIVGRPVDRAAAVYADAVLRHGKESHGCFMMNQKIAPLATFYYTPDGKKATA